MQETSYSFSRDDLSLFLEYNLDVLRGCDELYTYEFTRDATQVDDEPADWMNLENFNHADMIRNAKVYNIGYRRWQVLPDCYPAITPFRSGCLFRRHLFRFRNR